MPSTEQLRARLLNKLKELFQLDQPDLDFGFYRIMHARSQEIQGFIDNELLAEIGKAFADAGGGAAAKHLKDARNMVLDSIGEEAFTPDGNIAPQYANAKYAKAYAEAAKAVQQTGDIASAEADVYNHLYRFFERYYDNGDFISRRYLTRESGNKAAPFAIPYNGEEVKLHWANADQYYIKTAEHFTNYTVDLRHAQEVVGQDVLTLDGAQDLPLKLHFRIVGANEGEHGNVKASASSQRFFIIHAANPVEITAEGELILNFEYRSDPQKTGQESGWREKRNTEAVALALKTLNELAGKKDAVQKAAKFYAAQLSLPAGKDGDRPLLARYVNQYTARNTMDYFIHKDLGGFLLRELDFYLKNEVMRLDDIERADAPAVESWLKKIKVIRGIAHKLIDFLAQCENFQKKLWLKKKFVVDTQICITLDRVPAALYPQIATNDSQIDEWVRLFAIDEIKADTTTPGFSRPLTVEFLKANDKLVLDTRFFDGAFKELLIASIPDFDEQCDGLLVHSENFQALNLLQARYREQVKCIYIDPPYNAAATEILYKNGYRSSSWCSLIYERLIEARKYLTDTGILCVTIDDYELYNLKKLGDLVFSPENYLSTVLIRNNPSGRSTVSGFAICHEYALYYANNIENCLVGRLPHSDEQKSRYDLSDKDGNPFEWENFRKSSAGSYRHDRPKQYFPLYLNEKKIKLRVPECQWNDQKKEWVALETPLENEIVIFPVDSQKRHRVWNFGVERTRATLDEMKVEIRDGNFEVYKKKYLQQQGILPRTWWEKPEYSARDSGTRALSNLFAGQKNFDFPKAVVAVKDSLLVGALSEEDIVLDFFAGSGTTGHAVIDLNREDELDRRYILVEMGDYFDTVLKPRIAKVVYADTWRDGKPQTRHTGVSHCFKTVRLESYEDTLNNLKIGSSARGNAMSQHLRQDFMLHYLLDVTTQGSASLLNLDDIADPRNYILNVKQPGSDVQTSMTVDLIETFNFLLGLRVVHLAQGQAFEAAFARVPDPDLPKKANQSTTKLAVDGDLTPDPQGQWWLRGCLGWVPTETGVNGGGREGVLVIWRTLTGNLEEDNAVLDAWFAKFRERCSDFALHTVYVNGSSNLRSLRPKGEAWEVRLIEQSFAQRMWGVSE